MILMKALGLFLIFLYTQFLAVQHNTASSVKSGGLLSFLLASQHLHSDVTAQLISLLHSGTPKSSSAFRKPCVSFVFFNTSR